MSSFSVLPPIGDREAAAKHGRYIRRRVIGAVEDMGGGLLRIGIDHDTVTIGEQFFTLAQCEELAQVLVSAVWAAGANAQAMAQEVT